MAFRYYNIERQQKAVCVIMKGVAYSVVLCLTLGPHTKALTHIGEHYWIDDDQFLRVATTCSVLVGTYIYDMLYSVPGMAIWLHHVVAILVFAAGFSDDWKPVVEKVLLILPYVSRPTDAVFMGAYYLCYSRKATLAAMNCAYAVLLCCQAAYHCVLFWHFTTSGAGPAPYVVAACFLPGQYKTMTSFWKVLAHVRRSISKYEGKETAAVRSRRESLAGCEERADCAVQTENCQMNWNGPLCANASSLLIDHDRLGHEA